MLLILETIFLHGFLTFVSTFQYFYVLHCFITLEGSESSSPVAEPLVDAPLCESKVKPTNVVVLQKAIEVEKVSYEETVLTNQHMDFFDAFTNSLSATTDNTQQPVSTYQPVSVQEELEPEPVLSYEYEQEPVFSYEYEPEPEQEPIDYYELEAALVETFELEPGAEIEKEEVEEEMLSMNNWNKEPEPVAVTETLASVANAQINDYQLGSQVWVVEVIGEEAGYLHVSDGSGRAWVNTKNLGAFVKNDILSLEVDRKSDLRVNLLHAIILQEHSTDFCIIDDIEQFDFIEQAESIGA